MTNATDTIVVSKDSTLAILEIDHYLPIMVFDLNTFQLKHSISSNQIVKQATFLDTEKTVMIVFGQLTLIYVDLLTGEQFELSPLSATTFASDQMGSYFTCINDSLTHQMVNFTRTGINES